MKRLVIILLSFTLLATMTGCNFFTNEFGQMMSAFKGREAIIQTYDEESNIIDQIVGKSIDIGANDSFSTKDSEGTTTQKSTVLSITVGGKNVTHVGSSLILYEKKLTNVFEEYAKTVDIKNTDRSTPFLNRMVNNMKNLTTGQEYVVLIRSQSGKPLATFVGDDVSYFATDIDKSTGFIIDGQYLFVYRCDYSIIPLSLLQ